ncbi:hypothetical protein BDV93DRAFT_511741 [Ceratobasidium sp. AG-I]|nr:hypothetical protein BDV93DRAFT_511740 [Ceratobasidium sp. AG-I]KAF8599343.1 hypothetical protein BDV93DRAFT_511741 [Ceratobasidium sp. AG-I]
MFAFKLTLFALFTLQFALALPTALVSREDWKIALGWNGKVTTPVQLDASNATKDTIAVGLPSTSHLPNLICFENQKRDVNGVFFCTDADFKGRCVYVRGFSSGQCVGVGSDFNDNVSSFGPDQGMTCTIYSDAGCGGRATGGVIFPGINNLADFNNNDSMSSFSCSG